MAKQKRHTAEGIIAKLREADVELAKRRVQIVFRAWQVIAGFDRLYPFHALRHRAVTNIYRASRVACPLPVAIKQLVNSGGI